MSKRISVLRLCTFVVVAVLVCCSLVACATLGQSEHLTMTTEDINSAASSVLEEPSLIASGASEETSSSVDNLKGDDEQEDEDEEGEVSDTEVDEQENHSDGAHPCNKTATTSVTTKTSFVDQQEGSAVVGRAVSVNFGNQRDPSNNNNNNKKGVRGKRRPAQRCKGKRKGSCKRRRGNRKPGNRGASRKMKSTTASESRTTPAA